jgi:hypothetical protein
MHNNTKADQSHGRLRAVGPGTRLMGGGLSIGDLITGHRKPYYGSEVGHIRNVVYHLLIHFGLFVQVTS